MGIEIERKFTVKNKDYRTQAQKVYIEQGFLNAKKERVVRIRIEDQKAFLTVKGKNQGISRYEFEYKIPIEEAKIMLDILCIKPIICKWRYRIKLEELTWEVDEFLKENNGLIVAEVELPNKEYPLQLPDWIDKEVSGDEKYYNSNLIKKPYQSW